MNIVSFVTLRLFAISWIKPGQTLRDSKDLSILRDFEHSVFHH